MTSDTRLVTDALSCLIGLELFPQADHPGQPPTLDLDTLNRLAFAKPELQITARNGLSTLSLCSLSSPLSLCSLPSSLTLSSNFIDPQYNFDFTDVNDAGRSFFRGKEEYKRPCGWRRYALNVAGKYDSDVWLGSSNVPGEWPVSYHGTSMYNAEEISETSYDLSKGKRFAFGKGIYSTPDHNIAELYASEFTCEGRRYKVILQNRVHPLALQLDGAYSRD
ncbi:hypothetical protein ABKA04_005711 [Annulohypoxylon sp. FPYF3050]